MYHNTPVPFTLSIIYPVYHLPCLPTYLSYSLLSTSFNKPSTLLIDLHALTGVSFVSVVTGFGFYFGFLIPTGRLVYYFPCSDFHFLPCMLCYVLCFIYAFHALYEKTHTINLV